MSETRKSVAPELAQPAYSGDEDQNRLDAHQEPVFKVHDEPDEPDSDVQAGSGKVDFGSGRPADATGADAPSHNST
jgi:hypothetical protein